MKILFITLVTLLAGCAPGVRHHLILGFGVVSVAQTNVVATVVRTRALGLVLSEGQANLGWSSQLTTTVFSNAVLEAK